MFEVPSAKRVKRSELFNNDNGNTHSEDEDVKHNIIPKAGVSTETAALELAE